MTLLIFDIDGTLVYSERRDSQCFAATYEQLYGRPFPSIDWSGYPHVTDTTIFSTVIERHFRRRPAVEEVHVFQEAYVRLLTEKRRLDPGHSQEVPGARAAMERLLADERFAVGVATGGWQRPAHLKLRHVGIPSERLPLQGADGKHTREDIIRALLDQVKRLHPEIRQMVYIGDAVWDVRTTRNLNMAFVGLRWQGDTHVLKAAGARQVVTDYVDYDAFLDIVQRAEVPGNGKG